MDRKIAIIGDGEAKPPLHRRLSPSRATLFPARNAASLASTSGGSRSVSPLSLSNYPALNKMVATNAFTLPSNKIPLALLPPITLLNKLASIASEMSTTSSVPMKLSIRKSLLLVITLQLDHIPVSSPRSSTRVV